jgi:hypothetical protein
MFYIICVALIANELHPKTEDAFDTIIFCINAVHGENITRLTSFGT